MTCDNDKSSIDQTRGKSTLHHHRSPSCYDTQFKIYVPFVYCDVIKLVGGGKMKLVFFYSVKYYDMIICLSQLLKVKVFWKATCMHQFKTHLPSCVCREGVVCYARRLPDQ